MNGHRTDNNTYCKRRNYLGIDLLERYVGYCKLYAIGKYLYKLLEMMVSSTLIYAGF